ncbi:PH domain-containing protein [Natronomonas salsuginis]|uniref:SHOCT domain-containing protein n=1 Tax=Natronomonas salsuginis TaxID=2217661 RepID=A0A4U5JAQ8_9EURY|nr:PH domain-containing protein [Natronomonas salsuginis]TKR25884.1 hypothetical protein DM868_05135 [Natronomonas salsuginis]
MPHCPNCGEGFSTQQNFCRECGEDVSEIVENSDTSSQKEATDKSGMGRGAYVTDTRIKKVESVLDDDETVHYLTRGSTVDVEGSSAGTSLFGDDRSRKSGTKGYVRAAITDKRVAVKIPQWLGSDERSIPYDSITSVDLDTGLVNKRISLQTPGQTYHIEVHEPGKDECRDAVRFIREKISETKQQQVITQESADPDPTEQLKNIKQLHDEGVLTEKEFEEKKQSLLDKL